MSEVVEVTTMAELNELIATEHNLVLDFAAPSWCIPCQRLAPHYEAAAKAMPDVKFVHIDIEEADPKIAEAFAISSVPTVMAFIGNYNFDVKGRTAPALVREIQERINGDSS